MDILKGLLRNGLGSPGVTAKTFAEQYNRFPKSDHSSQWKTIFQFLFAQRLTVALKLKNIGGSRVSTSKMEDIVEFSEGDLPLLVFEMMYLETSQFRENIYFDNKLFALATEVIYEVVRDYAPSAITLEINDFRLKALQFISIYHT